MSANSVGNYIWPRPDLEKLYGAVCEAGAPYGLCDFGSYALNAMRIEKGYHGWGADFGIEYTLYDAGLERFANVKKEGFVGRDAAIAQSESSPDWSFVGLEILDPGPDALASDPINRNGEWIGYVTSCSMGFRTGKHLALGYVRSGGLAIGDRCTVSIFGEERTAVRHSPHVYDPDNQRLRG